MVQHRNGPGTDQHFKLYVLCDDGLVVLGAFPDRSTSSADHGAPAIKAVLAAVRDDHIKSVRSLHVVGTALT